MLIYLLCALAGTVAYLNAGYDLASKEKAKSGGEDWHKFDRSWVALMWLLPMLSLGKGLVNIAFFPVLRRHKKRIKEVAARRELEGEEDPKLLSEANKEADMAAKGISVPDLEPGPAGNALNQVLVPQILSPKDPLEKK